MDDLAAVTAPMSPLRYMCYAALEMTTLAISAFRNTYLLILFFEFRPCQGDMLSSEIRMVDISYEQELKQGEKSHVY